MNSGYDEQGNPIECHVWRGITWALMIEIAAAAFVAGLVVGIRFIAN